MQTYTHVLVGAVVGKMIAPDSELVQAATIVSATVPDVPIFLQLVTDKLKGVEVYSGDVRWWHLAKEVSHSPFLWLVSLVVSLSQSGDMSRVLLGIGLGFLSHWVIDVLSHSGEEFLPTDCSMIWPVGRRDFRLGGFIGFWEYRRRQANFAPKVPEFLIDVLCLYFSWEVFGAMFHLAESFLL